MKNLTFSHAIALVAAGMLTAFATLVSAASLTPSYPPSNADCPQDRPYCRVRELVEPAALEERLAKSDFASWTEGNRLHVVVRASQQPMFCCTIQMPMAQVGETDIWSLTLEIPRLDEAVVLLAYMDHQHRLQSRGEFRGAKAPRRPDQSEPLKGKIEEAPFTSSALGLKTSVSLYWPPEDAGPIRAVIYLADGGVETIAPVLDAQIAQKRIPSTAIVGFAAWTAVGEDHQARSAARNAQYRRGYDPQVMARHDRFVFDELIPQMEHRLKIQSPMRIAMGASNGGAWAMTTAMSRPDLFGGAISVSPAIARVDLSGLEPSDKQHYYFAAGLFEGLRNMQLAYDRIHDSPATACMLAGVDGHSWTLTRDFFAVTVRSALSGGSCPSWR